MHRFRSASLLALALALPACGDDPAGEAAPGAPAPDAGAFGCAPGELALADGGCLAAGMQANGCAAGEVAGEAGKCRPAGIAAEACASGFVADDAGGCIAILPSEACPVGLVAIPGETTCRELAPCGAGTWGDIPIEPDTQHVEAAYALGSSDGTASNPWTTIQAAVDAAADGAIVAVAEGSYAEDVLIQGKHVRLWGRCPALVKVAGAGGFATLDVRQGASSSEMRDLSVGGDNLGIGVSGAKGVLVDRVWVYGTGWRGMDIESTLGASSVAVTRSLVEGAVEFGIFVLGAELAFDASVVRGTLPNGSGKFGRGISVQADDSTRATATVTASVIERNRKDGVFVMGSDATITGSVVRETVALENGDVGAGLLAFSQSGVVERAKVAVTGSVFERNALFGALVVGSDAAFEATVLRDTVPGADGTFGRGIEAQYDVDAGERAAVSLASCIVENHADVGVHVAGSDFALSASRVRDTSLGATADGGRGINVQTDAQPAQRASASIEGSVVERCGDLGIYVAGADVAVEGSVVRDTEANGTSGGRGINVQDHPQSGERATFRLRSSVIDDCATVGVMVLGSEATIEASVVRATASAPDGYYGRGIEVEPDEETGQAATAAIRGSLVEDSHETGVGIFGATVSIEASLVRRTAGRFDGLGGDGIIVMSDPMDASSTLEASRIEASARAGVASFGAAVGLHGNVLDCNPIDLDGEPWNGIAFSFEDRGENTCGCGAAPVACRVSTDGLAPPPLMPGF